MKVRMASFVQQAVPSKRILSGDVLMETTICWRASLMALAARRAASGEKYGWMAMTSKRRSSVSAGSFQPRDVEMARRSAEIFEMVSNRQSMAAFEVRSEEHTSELQSQSNLVCRLLLEKNH